ncbi:MAG: HAMP domain-containing sensor histidine kinase [Gammaproteobacteria bacterium]
MNQQEGRGSSGGATALSRNVSGLLPDGLFARMLAIVVACVAIPEIIALAIAPQAHRSSLLGSFFMLLPPLACGVYFMARSVTRPLAKLTDEADSLGRRAEIGAVTPTGALELRRLMVAFDLAQARVEQYVTHRARSLAAMSHDLKTPLTRMRLRVETLDDDATRDPLNRDLDEITGMVTSTLATLKGMENPEADEPIDINALLARMQKEYAEMGRSVSIRGQARRPYVGRVSALKRCLTNLIDNAVKFGEKASVTLEDGSSLRVRVADRGPGIAVEEMDRVFEPFYRARAALARGVEGTGLGLSIARDIVLGHGGQLTLRNREACGLEAEVVLPRVVQKAALH